MAFQKALHVFSSFCKGWIRECFNRKLASQFSWRAQSTWISTYEETTCSQQVKPAKSAVVFRRRSSSVHQIRRRRLSRPSSTLVHRRGCVWTSESAQRAENFSQQTIQDITDECGATFSMSTARFLELRWVCWMVVRTVSSIVGAEVSGRGMVGSVPDALVTHACWSWIHAMTLPIS